MREFLSFLEFVMVRAYLLRLAAGVCILACTLLGVAEEDAWIEVKSPNFIIISNASVKQARQVAKKLEQFRLTHTS